ncbi:Arm DNA-binding domain-containing protein [Roseovarius sp. BRH_c41]|jgi:hypothetical protein|uniref:Arm DNA-binding domain-containing protein n=1 Tax=Roseovarius sp. BRH_c41 TaxID=1629709 RepID=UPI000A74C6AF|nr:Arm DNA-binding domain-containing protein [Roseovarius sp. BRH_c41]
MAKSNEFTVAELKSLPSGKYCDGQGLWLHKRADGGGQWVFRFCLWGRQREMGLGSLKTVSLADARRKTDMARKQVHEGIDPVKERRLQRQQANARDGRLEALATATFEAQKPSLKGANANGAWLGPLRVHVLPKIG